jgi:CHAT domain-containing protein
MKKLVVIIEPEINGSCAVAVHLDDGAADWKTIPKAAGAIDKAHVEPADPANPAQPLLPKGGMVGYMLREDRPRPAFQTIGDHLWSLLNAGNVGTFLASTWQKHARTHANDPKEGLAVVLDIRDEALQVLPWELMLRSNLPLFASPLNPFVRGPLDPVGAPLPSGLLLRVLVLVGSAPGDPAVKAEEEIEYLEDAVRVLRREIDLRVERPRSSGDLATLYSDFGPHVLHFIGHGGEVQRPGGKTIASLVFEDGKGGRWDWTTADIAGTLAVGAPRLAFLNACRTAAQTQSARELLRTLAVEFLAAGTCGVIAMQADIAGAAAASFSGASYAALARGERLDAALALARFGVRQQPGEADRRDWALPSLTVRVEVSDVLPARIQLEQTRRDVLETTPEFVSVQAFVDRKEQRVSVDPLAAPDRVADVLVVSGAAESGKTSMLLWFLEGCAWCNHIVRYVDLKRTTTAGFRDVLAWIIDGQDGSASELRQPVKGNFTRVRDLLALARSGQPGAGAAPPDDLIDTLFTAFRTALVQAANQETLVIALDHIGSMDVTEFHKFIRPRLLDYVMQRKMRPVRFVLCGTDTEIRALQLHTLQPPTVGVTNFSAAEFIPLYREYLLKRDVPRGKIPPPPIVPTSDFPPKMLADTYDFLARWGKLGN